MKIKKSYYIREFAERKLRAVEKCETLGRKFIEHFRKAFYDTSEGARHHHIAEMQAWWDCVKDIRIKSSNRVISSSDLMDWFFTAGALYGDFLESNDEIDCYEALIDEMIYDRKKKIQDIWDEIFDY